MSATIFTHLVVFNAMWCKKAPSMEGQHEVLNQSKLLPEKQAVGMMDKATHDGLAGSPLCSA